MFMTVVGFSAAYFAASSALSFPSMSLCPGIQVIVTSTFGCSALRCSRLSMVALTIDCPDCLPGFTVVIIAALAVCVYGASLGFIGDECHTYVCSHFDCGNLSCVHIDVRFLPQVILRRFL